MPPQAAAVLGVRFQQGIKGSASLQFKAMLIPFFALRWTAPGLIVRDYPELAQQATDLGFVEFIHQQFAQERGAGDIDRLAVTQTAGCGQQRADVVGGVEYLRHTALYLEQCVDGLHRRAYRILGGEDAIALLGFRELADEGKVH
jgi:hypothetical protein